MAGNVSQLELYAREVKARRLKHLAKPQAVILMALPEAEEFDMYGEQREEDGPLTTTRPPDNLDKNVSYVLYHPQDDVYEFCPREAGGDGCSTIRISAADLRRMLFEDNIV